MTIAKTELAKINAQAEQAGGPDGAQKQHKQGKLTARERVEILLDPGTFVETDKLRRPNSPHSSMPNSPEDKSDNKIPYGDGVITGAGTIDGRQVFVYSQDFTVKGGSIGAAHAEKICKIMDLATQVGSPIVALCESGGARIEEGLSALNGSADIYVRNMLASGVVPQIACVMGPCIGSAVYPPALSDFVFAVENTCYLSTKGLPKKVARGQAANLKNGSGQTHATQSGVVHFLAPDDQSCLEAVRELLSFLPSNNAEDPPAMRSHDDPGRECPELLNIIPDSNDKPYDVKQLIKVVVDDGYFVEIQPLFGGGIITALARIAGRSVGIVANQPLVNGGELEVNAVNKAARFVRLCDCYNLPVITLKDVPASKPGEDQSQIDLFRHAAKLLYAYAEATVPKVTVTIRKAHGAAHLVMASKGLRADLNLALTSAEIAVMDPAAAIEHLYAKELAAAPNQAAFRLKLIEDYRAKIANPVVAAERGFVDELISPEFLRPRLARALDVLRDKRQSNPPRKHGNIPL